VIGDNAPYSATDTSDFTIPVHGERRGLHHVAIEIRQDLIAEDPGQRAWGVLLARLLQRAYQGLPVSRGAQTSLTSTAIEAENSSIRLP
jgi:predicted N-formylglutamate amidohydrolase